MKIELPDVNLLVPLFDDEHQHHEVAMAWFEQAKTTGWALCPITISGFLRISSRSDNKGISNPFNLSVRLKGLTQANSQTYYYWSDDVSLLDDHLFDLSKIQGYRQLSDLHLLGIALQYGGTLVTMDTGIRQTLNAVRRPPSHLLRVLEEDETEEGKQ
jgi:uncharacterized protein